MGVDTRPALLLTPNNPAAMDRDSLSLQIANMRFQAKMERWPLSKSIEAMKAFIEDNEKGDFLIHSRTRRSTLGWRRESVSSSEGPSHQNRFFSILRPFCSCCVDPISNLSQNTVYNLDFYALSNKDPQMRTPIEKSINVTGEIFL